MSTPQASFGYAIVYVKDVAATLAFYEKAFGLTRRFYTGEGGKEYGELETGSTRLAFCGLNLAEELLRQAPVTTAPDKAPLAFELALTTPDVPALFAQAVAAGAAPVLEPAVKPWGQTVSYVRDLNGTLVEICTPMP